MAETKRMTADEVVGYLLEGEGLDFLRESLTWVVQQLMEAEVTELVGAAHGERVPEERLAQRQVETLAAPSSPTSAKATLQPASRFARTHASAPRRRVGRRSGRRHRTARGSRRGRRPRLA